MKTSRMSNTRHKRILNGILVMSLLVFGGIGVYMQSLSSAATVNSAYILRVTDENGCWMAGRKWDSAKSDCTASCRGGAGPYRTVTVDGKDKGYCTAAIAQTITVDDCVNVLHRFYSLDRGCAKRVDGDNTNNARQCLPGYPNYVADGGRDRCVAQTIVKETVTTDKIPEADCQVLGRTYDRATAACSRVCSANTGSLVVGSVSKQYFCTLAVQTDMAKTRCDELHRKWLTDGCARRADQADAENAVQCAVGYPYYNANFRSAGTSTTTDVCESSKAAAINSEAAGKPAASSVPPVPVSNAPSTATAPNKQTGTVRPVVEGSTGTSAGDIKDLLNITTCAKSRVVSGAVECLSDPTVLQASANTTDIVVDLGINESRCTLLGRQWVPASKGVKGGCSVERCTRVGVKMKIGEAKEYCQGYVSKIKKSKCNELHRKWMDEVGACALVYNQERKRKIIVDAEQCEKPYTTYVIHESSEARDECLKPKIVERLQGIAKSANESITYVSSLPPRGVCLLRDRMIWVNNRCVKQPSSVVVEQVGGKGSCVPGSKGCISKGGTADNPIPISCKDFRQISKLDSTVCLPEKSCAVGSFSKGSIWLMKGSKHYIVDAYCDKPKSGPSRAI